MSTAIVTLFIISDALSFSFSPIPLAKSRSSLTVRSFILEPSENGSSTCRKKRFPLPPRDNVVEHQALCDLATNNRIINSVEDGGIIKKHNLFSRIEETMEFAGFESPLRAGGKETFFALIILYGIKLFRNKYLLKGQSKLNEFQPQWGHVVTSKEEDVNLHAYTCKKCGATIFIAKGREWRFFSPFVECTNCGAKGKENFFDRRKEIVDEVDDGTFVYESFVDYSMSKRAKKKAEEEKKRIEEEIQRRAAEESAEEEQRRLQEEGTSEKTALVAETNDSTSMNEIVGQDDAADVVIAEADVLAKGDGENVEKKVIETAKAPSIKTVAKEPAMDLDVLDMDEF